MNVLEMERRERTVALVALVLLFALASQARTRHARGASLTTRIDRILARQPGAANWGIEVVALDSGRELYSKNPDQLFIPASNFKLLTTAAAFAIAGPDYRFHTRLESESPPDANGRIRGDLVLVGGGDPGLSIRALPYSVETERSRSPLWLLEQFADELARSGVKQVDGGVIGDDRFYPWEPYADGWAQDDLEWYYGAPVSALSINDNMIQAAILPGAAPGAPAAISFDPATSYYDIHNRIVTAPAGTRREIGIRRLPGSGALEFWGAMPLDDPGDRQQLAIQDPAEFAALALKAALQARGIQVLGPASARHLEPWQIKPPLLPGKPPSQPELSPKHPAQAMSPQPAGSPRDPQTQSSPAALQSPVVLAGYDSPRLAEDLEVINKVSQNLHAELALRLIGKLSGGDGSLESGIAALAAFLSRAGVGEDQYSAHDGCGLSREDLVTPRALVTLLRYAAAQPWGAQYEQTLPIAGLDGSLKDRFRGSVAAGRVHAKTGGMEHVRALSGYATIAPGRRVAFSILLNDYNMSGAQAIAAVDEIVVALFNSHAQKTAGSPQGLE